MDLYPYEGGKNITEKFYGTIYTINARDLINLGSNARVIRSLLDDACLFSGKLSASTIRGSELNEFPQ